MLYDTHVHTYLTDVKVAKTTGELPWWLNGKEPPAKAEDAGLITAPGGSHMPRSNETCVPQLLSLCPRAQEPHLPKPLSPRAQAPRQEKSLQREARTPLRSSPRSLQLEKSPHSNKDPAQPKIK